MKVVSHRALGLVWMLVLCGCPQTDPPVSPSADTVVADSLSAADGDISSDTGEMSADTQVLADTGAPPEDTSELDDTAPGEDTQAAVDTSPADTTPHDSASEDIALEDTSEDVTNDAGVSDVQDTVSDDTQVVDTGPDVSDTSLPDVTPEPTEPILVSASETPAPEIASTLIMEGAFDAAYPVLNGTWLESALGSQLMDAPEGSVLAIDGIQGDVLKVEVLGNQVVLVITTEDIYAFNGKLAAQSPLGSAISDPPILDVVDASEKDAMVAWFVTDALVYLWKDGVLTSVALSGVNFTGAQVTYGPLFEGQPAFWVAVDDRLFALVDEEPEVAAWEVLDNAPIDGLGADLEGNLWVLQQGDLFRRTPEADWTWFTFQSPLLELVGHRSSWMIWLRFEDSLWGHFAGEFWPFETLSVPSFMHLGAKETMTAVVGGNVTQLVVGSLPDPPVPPTSWSEDIAPISEAKCGVCHGPGQFAHEMASYQQWVDEYADILLMVETGQMPLAPIPALTALELQRLVDWEAGGFAP